MTGQVRPGKKKTVISRIRDNKSLKKHICGVNKDKKILQRRKGNKIHLHQDKQVKKRVKLKMTPMTPTGLTDRL